MYVITKVNRWFSKGAAVTSEKTLKSNATLEEVLNIASKQEADMEEVTEELETMGITAFKGYMISEL